MEEGDLVCVNPGALVPRAYSLKKLKAVIVRIGDKPIVGVVKELLRGRIEAKSGVQGVAYLLRDNRVGDVVGIADLNGTITNRDGYKRRNVSGNRYECGKCTFYWVLAQPSTHLTTGARRIARQTALGGYDRALPGTRVDDRRAHQANAAEGLSG